MGYASASTKGSGTGVGLSGLIADALWEAVEVGVKEFNHFEEIGILREGIGADRISDITANLIRHRLSAYTREVCNEFEIPIDRANYRRGRFDLDTNTWTRLQVQLPRNPETGRPILLVPTRYLRPLPTISPEDFWEYCYTNENKELRREFGEDISRNVNKRQIIRLARRRADLRREYLQARERQGSDAYDFEKDPLGETKWYQESKEIVERNPLTLSIDSPEKFEDALGHMIRSFQTFVRQNRGWELLWNDDRSNKRERASQLLMYGTLVHYCRANDIDISREADIGRGPLDFKLSSGYERRAVIEVKLAKNTSFWHGVEKQLPAYMKAEGINLGYFVIVILRDKDLERVEGIRDVIRGVEEKRGYTVRHAVVDARYGGPPSASRA